MLIFCALGLLQLGKTSLVQILNI